jgi:tRNA uridine 5-carboxymethylaminomethyl modification enzyme
MEQYDVIVIGGGHAGTEAALGAARMGASTLLVTQSLATVGQMSCNPAIGGIGKGHLVREVDAMGGAMAVAADRAGIQFRTLNASKGPAVRATRAQADRTLYKAAIRAMLGSQPNLALREAEVADLAVAGSRVTGVVTMDGTAIAARAVVLTVGTFLGGRIHVGLESSEGGRIGDAPSNALAARLRELPFTVGRLKTGTPPRIDGRTLDYGAMRPQPGDEPRPVFSFLGRRQDHPRQVHCHITATNAGTHEIIRGATDRSPMFTGLIEGVGPRYCPSVEDKVVRFAAKASHQIFVEPEGLDTHIVYPNGISTSLPADVQLAFVRTIAGFARAEITRPGYAIEYDYFCPKGLHDSLATRSLTGLFFAGQINGTTGYEEAGAQGMIAGINAALKAGGSARDFIVSRADGYVGVMIDDLITRGVSEPYRMFTSRAEYRLRLRADNADQRLTPAGLSLGCVGTERSAAFERKSDALRGGRGLLESLTLTPNEAARHGLEVNRDGRRRSAFELLAYPGMGLARLREVWPQFGEIAPAIAAQLEVDARYAAYVDRQEADVETLRREEDIRVPPDLAYEQIAGLSAEICQKLAALRPATLAQAGRMEGMTPAALMLLLAHLRKGPARKTA